MVERVVLMCDVGLEIGEDLVVVLFERWDDFEDQFDLVRVGGFDCV